MQKLPTKKMKNKQTFKIAACFAAILMCSSLASCSSSDANKDYYIVTYHYNFEGAPKDVYLKQYVMKDQDLMKPAEPNRVDYAFSGWCTDKEGKRQYRYFDEYVEKDLDLYASWKTYDSLSDVEKINRFIERVESLSGNVMTTSEQYNETIIYGFMGTGFSSKEDRLYQRYADITTADYTAYSKNASGEEVGTLIGKEQYFYDDSKFYRIYNDEDTTSSTNDSTYAEANFNENNVENFLNINYANRNFSILKELADSLAYPVDGVEIDYGTDVTEDQQNYNKEFNFNYTYVTSETVNYSFSLIYYRGRYSDEMGAYVEEIYELEYGFGLTNGFIDRSKTVEQYVFAIGGEIYQLQEITKEASYTQGPTDRPFTGEKYNPEDYKKFQSN